MLRPRRRCAPISVICLMLVVPDVEVPVLPLRPSTLFSVPVSSCAGAALLASAAVAIAAIMKKLTRIVVLPLRPVAVREWVGPYHPISPLGAFFHWQPPRTGRERV